MPGVRVSLCATKEIPMLASVKRDGVSFINNIEYGSEGMKVWRSYAIGPGKFLAWNIPESYSVPVLNTFEAASIQKLNSQQSNQVLRKSSQTQQEDVQSALDMSEASGDESDDIKECTCHDKLFSCAEDGCIKSFERLFVPLTSS